MRLAVFALLILALVAAPARAHDPSAWGGSFRTRDGGKTWTPIDAGLFIGGAVTLAVDPNDSNHLLYATDSRMLRSRNGGRDWSQEPAAVFAAPTLAVTFAPDGNTVLAATAAGVFRSGSTIEWHAVNVPAAANPVLAIVAGTQAGRFYLAGARGMFRSDDHGESWTRSGEALPDAPITGLVVARSAAETVVVVVDGNLYASIDGGVAWQSRGAGLPERKVEALAMDPVEGRLWVAAAGKIYRSDAAGEGWQPQGQPLPEPGIDVRGIAASADASTIVLTTHRGLYRSTDAGQIWNLVEGSVPVHLEASPLVRDPNDASTLYAGFSLTPYTEIRRRAQEGSNLLSQVDVFSLAGAAAFLGLVIIGGLYIVRRLWRASPSSGAATTTTRTR